MSRFQVDDVIQAKVINISRKDKKIGLSIRKLDESSEKDILKSYLNNNQKATSNLGQLLKEEMMNAERNALSEDLKSEEESGVKEAEEVSGAEPDEQPLGGEESQGLTASTDEAEEAEATETTKMKDEEEADTHAPEEENSADSIDEITRVFKG
jgi:predicted RNA-binding protein with RPS1 domain